MDYRRSEIHITQDNNLLYFDSRDFLQNLLLLGDNKEVALFSSCCPLLQKVKLPLSLLPPFNTLAKMKFLIAPCEIFYFTGETLIYPSRLSHSHSGFGAAAAIEGKFGQ